MNIETERMICENCGCIIDEEKTENIGNIIECSDGSVFCSEECANANDYYRCGCCGAYVNDAYYIEDTGEDICQDCFCNNRDYFQCDDCGKYFSSNSLGKYDDWNAYCEKCSQEYIYCEDCGAVIHINDEYLIDGNYYCSYCAENHLHGSDLYDYRYKPCPEFYGDTGENNQLFIGVELEVDEGDNANKLYCELGGFEEIYCKHDGSLGDEGVEIVSHPCTLKYHMESLKWNDIMNICLENGYASHDAGTCGIHTHVNRTFFGDTEDEQDLNIAKVVLLMNRFFESHIVPFSRRNYSQLSDWARKNNIQKIYNTDNEVIVSEKVKASKNSGRYQAVNLQNINTIEFRVFRGTLKYSTFIAILQFIDTICRFAKQINLNHIDNTKWEDIFAGTKWPELNSYLKERTDFDPCKVEKIMAEMEQCNYIPIKNRHDIAIGDVVVIRDWNDMAEEFGISGNGFIKCNLYFVPRMRRFCGQTAKVIRISKYDSGYRLSLDFDDPTLNYSNYNFSSDMINVIATRNDEFEEFFPF